MNAVEFRFHGELNDFLPMGRSNRKFGQRVASHSTVKDAIEALGVPHTEIGRVEINGVPAELDARLGDGDRVEVAPLSSVAGPLRFVLDSHLGRLARYLRMLGLDTLYRNDCTDEQLALTSAAEDRILLTRDIGLLKRSIVRRGYWLRADDPEAQLAEVVRRLDVGRVIAPFGRCIRCNGKLEPVDLDDVADRLPPRTRREHTDFRRCERCARVYWKGSHYERMLETIGRVLPGAGDPAHRER